MRNLTFIFIFLLVSCTKDMIEDVVIDPPSYSFETLSERFSTVNETTNYFKSQEHFSNYFSNQFLESLTYSENNINYRVYGQSIVVFDYNRDNKQDLFAFATSFCSEHPYSFHTGKFILISDYKKEAIKTIIDSTFFYGVTLAVGDFNNDNIDDILASSHDTKQNSYLLSEEQGGFSNNPFSKPRIISFASGVPQQFEVGVRQDTHAISSGDINNDGLVDFIQFPVIGYFNGSWENNNYTKPIVNLNNGGFTFSPLEIEIGQEYSDWYALSFELFDLNKDGALDIIAGTDIGVRKTTPIASRFSDNINGPVVLWGNNTGVFSTNNSTFLTEDSLSSSNRTSFILGFGFTDFDYDGDIDVVITTTRNEPDGDFYNGKYYRSYYLISFENKGLNTFQEVINISGSVDETLTDFTNFFYIKSIDYDQDGDIDLVPSGIPNWGSDKYRNGLWWKKEENTYTRSW